VAAWMGRTLGKSEATAKGTTTGKKKIYSLCHQQYPRYGVYRVYFCVSIKDP